jgi:hypothetical protein
MTASHQCRRTARTVPDGAGPDGTGRLRDLGKRGLRGLTQTPRTARIGLGRKWERDGVSPASAPGAWCLVPAPAPVSSGVIQ